MAISWVNAGALLNFSSNVQYGNPYAAPVAFPATVSAGNLAILEVTSKPTYPGVSPSIVNTPAGWTVLATAYGGGFGATEQAVNTGNVGYTLFYKVLAGTEGGTTVTVNVDDINSGLARIYVWSNATGMWNISHIAGEIASNAGSTSVTSTFSSGFSPATGDHVLYGLTHACPKVNSPDYSAESLTQTGTTFAASTEIDENKSVSYNGVGSLVCRTNVTAGGGTVAPTMAFTMYAINANLERGVTFAVLLGEVTPTTTQISGTSDLTFSSSANLLGKHAGSISGTSALTFTGSATLTTRVAMVGTSALTFSVERGFPDRSWTATATGARKSAQAGYIDPVYFANHQNHKGCAIFEVSAIGTVDFYVERVLGETGSISTTISTFEVLTGGARAGTHYTATSKVVTYTDGEIGWKKVSIPVTAIPTGFGVIGLQLSNYIPDGTGTARNEYCYIWLQGTGKVAGAKYLNSLGSGVESNGDTSGDGTEGNPWRCPSYAATQMGHGGGVLYVSSAGGNYQDSGANKSVGGGAFVFENLCTVTNPLICLPNPDNIVPVLVDNGLGNTYVANPATPQFAGGWSDYLSKAHAIKFGNAASHIWLVGINARHGGIFGNPAITNDMHHIVLWKLESRWAAFAGSNVHNIRFDSSYDCIYDSCIAAEAYTYEGGGGPTLWPSETPGPFYGTVPYMHQQGNIQSFKSYGMRVVGCTVDIAQYGLYQKDPPANAAEGFFGYVVKHCLFKRVKHGGVLISLAGSGARPAINTVVGYCVSDGNTRNGVGDQSNIVSVYMDAGTTAQTDRVDVYNCVNRLNRFVGNLGGDHVRYWNNISEDSDGGQYGSANANDDLGDRISRLEYGDYCLYVRGSAYRNTNNYAVDESEYFTLAAWRDVNVGNPDTYVIMAAPDLNSTETTITPAYADTTAFDYRYSNTLGYAGKAVGLDFMEVGAEIIYDTLYVMENGRDTFASTGTVGSNGLDATESGTDTLASTGTVLVAGSLAVTEAATDTFAGDDNVDGSLAVTEASSDTLASIGTVLVSGSMAATEATTDTMGAIAGTNLFTLPKNTVVKVAKGGSTFKAINLSTYQVRIKYSTTVPVITDNDWGILRGRKKELSLGLGMDLYAYSEFGGVLLVVSTDSIT